MNERRLFVVIVLVLFSIVFSAEYFADVDAYKQSGTLEKTPNAFYLRGDLTAKTENTSYGGDVIGDYLIVVNTKDVKVIATLDDYYQKRVFEAWFFDLDSDEELKIGTFDGNQLSADLTIDNWKYDLITISEKLSSDENIDIPIGGALLKKHPEYQSCKCS